MTLQPAAVLFPDVELWTVDYLDQALANRPESYTGDVLVSNTVPDPRVDRMVIVRRDGGAPSGLFDNPRLSVRVWAGVGREQDATDLARMVAALLWAAPDGATVVRVTQESGPSALPDPSGQPLRYSLFAMRTRGEVLT